MKTTLPPAWWRALTEPERVVLIQAQRCRYCGVRMRRLCRTKRGYRTVVFHQVRVEDAIAAGEARS